MTSAGSGPIRVQTTADASRSCVELAAEDFGPGIPDVPLALHAPASCLEARRKVLQVLLEVEGHAELDAVRSIELIENRAALVAAILPRQSR